MLMMTELSITDTRALISKTLDKFIRSMYMIYFFNGFVPFGITKIEQIAWRYSFNRTCKENIHSRSNASNILTTETVVPVSL